MNNDALRSAIKLILVFLTLIVILFTWMTGQFGDPQKLMLITILALATLLIFFLVNVMERRERRKRRENLESEKRPSPSPGSKPQKRSDASFSLKEKKSDWVSHTEQDQVEEAKGLLLHWREL